jgi:DNA mismatch repair protein MutS2
MDAKSIALLEFPLVRERLAAATGFPPGRRLAEALLPSPDPVLVEIGLEETSQARALIAEHPSTGIGGAHDIGPAVDRAARGGRLDAAQFAAIAQTLEAGSRLRDVLADDRRALLHALARELHPLPGLRSTLERSFDPAGELLDTASARLGALRRATRHAYERLRTRLEQLVHSSDVGGALQDPIVTLRNGRYVIPVRADARSRVKGIVHDASGSGQTLFVEPLVAVELGNAWREAQLAEAAEVERILDELSALVGSQAGPLVETLDALARFDFWSAKARLAEEMDAVRAEPARRTEIVLKGARHPGLSGHVVPIDVELGTEFRALVVTGPNTGGKTVTLRTIGLLVLMHQAGLHVPADPGSRLPVLADLFADIGDEQSVAQSLSTFSGHLRSIVRIAAAAGPATLILLDELGAGTDPTEGSALAQALLDHFLRTGALVAATTHYAELKVYAHTTPDVRNASVEFDLETLSPTYRLRIGLPGGSQAFAIAERLGLSSSIVDDARSRLSEGQQAFEETLASIRAADLATREALDRARAAEVRAAESQRAADEERRRWTRSSSAPRLASDGSPRRLPLHRRRRRRRPWPGASEPALAAGREAGRAGSSPWSAAARGRRSRSAGCGSRRPRWSSSRRSRPHSMHLAPRVRTAERLTRRRGSAGCASSGRGPSLRLWTCGGPGWTRPSRWSTATSRMPRWPASSARSSSTAWAPGHSATPCALPQPRTRWSARCAPASGERAGTGRRSSRSRVPSQPPPPGPPPPPPPGPPGPGVGVSPGGSDTSGPGLSEGKGHGHSDGVGAAISHSSVGAKGAPHVSP